MNHFDAARDKILMGTERRSMAMSEEEKPLLLTTKLVMPSLAA